MPDGPMTTRDHLFVSCFWLAYNLHWGALGAIVLPSQIAAIVGRDDKELYTGVVTAIGAAVALVIAPLAGALSDQSRSRFGRRRPFMLAGVIVDVLFLAALARLGRSGDIGLFMLCCAGVQLGSNVASGPYAGLVPDLVPQEQHGRASGWMALMSAAGMLAGALSAGWLLQIGSYAAVYGFVAASVVAMMALTWAGVREAPAAPQPRTHARSLFPSPKTHRDFYWVIATRAFVSMGIYSVITYLQYFLADVIGVAAPEEQASRLLGVIVAASIPATLAAGVLSDRWGRKPIVYATNAVMAVAAIIYAGLIYAPSLPATFAIGALFGAGYGAYQAVDWALAIDTLPGVAPARDMGLWHVALVLPQVLAPLATGLVLHAFEGASKKVGYAIAFSAAALWLTLGATFVRRVRKAR